MIPAEARLSSASNSDLQVDHFQGGFKLENLVLDLRNVALGDFYHLVVEPLKVIEHFQSNLDRALRNRTTTDAVFDFRRSIVNIVFLDVADAPLVLKLHVA